MPFISALVATQFRCCVDRLQRDDFTFCCAVLGGNPSSQSSWQAAAFVPSGIACQLKYRPLRPVATTLFFEAGMSPWSRLDWRGAWLGSEIGFVSLLSGLLSRYKSN